MSMIEDKACPFEEKTMLYAYGELSSAEAKAVQQHISVCKHCFTLVKTVQVAGQALSSIKEYPSETTVKYLANAALEYAASKKTACFSFRQKIAAFSLAAFLVISGVLFTVYRGGINAQVETAALTGNETSIFASSFDEDMYMLEGEFYSYNEQW